MEGDNVSIRNLAKETDISKSVIQNLRSGKQHDIKVSNLIKIVHVFGYDIILEKGNERLMLEKTITKDSKKHLSVVTSMH